MFLIDSIDNLDSETSSESSEDSDELGNRHETLYYDDTLFFLTDIPYLESYSKLLKSYGGILTIISSLIYFIMNRSRKN